MRIVIQIIIILLLSQVTFSQSKSDLIGRIIDAETKATIPFVTVFIKQKQLGVIANAEGDFRISQSSVADSDSLAISCIGYNKKVVSIKELSVGQVNIFFLEPRIVAVDEVEVFAKRKKIRSRSIVRKAIRSISNNYPQVPFNYVAYYRDYQKFNGKYLNLNEAIIENQDKGYDTDISLSRFKLLSLKENEDFERVGFPEIYNDGTRSARDRKVIPSATLTSYGGNELWILLAHDAIRRKNEFAFSFVDTLFDDFIVNHSFDEIEKVYNDTLSLYKIDFVSKKSKTPDTIIAEGSIYIEPGNNAIHNLNYSVFYQKRDEPIKAMFNVTLEYGRVRSLNSRMGIKYISFNNLFMVNDEKDENYFQLEKHSFHEEDYKMVLFFNRNVDYKSAKKKSNYSVSFGNVPVEIVKIKAYGYKVVLYLKKGQYDFNRLELKYSYVRDTEGNVVGDKNKLEVYQFRELFVQEFNPELKTQKDCYIKNLPLSENCINKIIGKNKYWMNSPVVDVEK